MISPGAGQRIWESWALDSWQPAISTLQGEREAGTAAAWRPALCVFLDLYTPVSVSDCVSQGSWNFRSESTSKKEAEHSQRCSTWNTPAGPVATGDLWRHRAYVLREDACARARATCVLPRFPLHAVSALPKHTGALYMPGSPTKLRVSRRWVLCRHHLCTLSANRVDQIMKDEAWDRTRPDGPAAFPGQGLCLPG